MIIGGDLSAAGELITEPVFESIRRYAIASAAEQVTVVAGVLGERAELLGALALVLHAGDGLLASQRLAPGGRCMRPSRDLKLNTERNGSDREEPIGGGT